MRYIIDMAIFGTLPEYTRIVLVARELDNTQNAPASRNMLHKAVQAAGSILADQAPASHPRLVPWQRAYAALGIRSRVGEESEEPEEPEGPEGSEGQGIPASLRLRTTRETPLTNILNAFALQNVLPVGGDDLDRIAGNVWLRPARGNEFFVPLGHPERPEAPAIGEIVYVDDGPNVLRRRWHGPQSALACITAHTRNALIYLDCLPPIDRAKAGELAGKLTRLVSGFFGAQVETYFLTREHPAVEIQL